MADTKNLKRIAREKEFLKLYELFLDKYGPEFAKLGEPLKSKYANGKRGKVCKHSRGGNSKRTDKRAWGPYREPTSPWTRK